MNGLHSLNKSHSPKVDATICSYGWTTQYCEFGNKPGFVLMRGDIMHLRSASRAYSQIGDCEFNIWATGF